LQLRPPRQRPKTKARLHLLSANETFKFKAELFLSVLADHQNTTFLFVLSHAHSTLTQRYKLLELANLLLKRFLEGTKRLLNLPNPNGPLRVCGLAGAVGIASLDFKKGTLGTSIVLP